MRIYCAPMEGITGALYRQVHHKYFGGIDRYFMPFISPNQDHILTKKDLRELAPENNDGLDAVPQLLTRRTGEFLWAVRELAAMGYREVNLNLGCPSGTVTAKGKGSGFLAVPEELDAFLDEIFSKSPISISVKTRFGMSRQEEFERLLEIYNQYPIQELTVHARVRSDFYKEPARIDFFGECWEKSKNPVCYNGDLFTANDCFDFFKRFPKIEAIMVGRGLIADPALGQKAAGGTGTDKTTLKRFHDELYEGYCSMFGSRKNAMMRMKELWARQITLFEHGEKFGKNIRKATDPVKYEALVADLFERLELLDHAQLWG